MNVFSNTPFEALGSALICQQLLGRNSLGTCRPKIPACFLGALTLLSGIACGRIARELARTVPAPALYRWGCARLLLGLSFEAKREISLVGSG